MSDYTSNSYGDPLPPRNWRDPDGERFTWSEAIERGFIPLDLDLSALQ